MKPLLKSTQTATSVLKIENLDITVSNILQAIKGAETGKEALLKLVYADAPVGTIQIFFIADKSGQIKYPV